MNSLAHSLPELNATAFYQKLGSVLQPAYVWNHLVTILELLELSKSTAELSKLLSPSDHDRVRDAIKTWTDLKRAADKTGRARQRARIAAGEFRPAPVRDVCNYLRRMIEFRVLEEALKV